VKRSSPSAGRASAAENTSRGLLILVVLFIILIGLIIAFSRTFITTVASAGPAASRIALFTAGALPLVLLGVTLFQIVRLLRQRALRQPGAGLKLRLTLFFILISILSGGPQALLAITFINSAMGTWFSSSIGDALRGATRMSIDFLQEKVQNLRSFSEGSLAEGLVREFPLAPDRTWRILREANAGIGALQLFSPDGGEIAFRGDARARLPNLAAFRGTSGIQPREDRGDLSVLRYVRPLAIGGMKDTVVVSSLLSGELPRNARRLTESLTLFRQLDRFRELFQTVLVAFFFVFSLPIFFITVLVSLMLTERIISPIVHLEDATRRVAEGDFSFRILTRPRDELANLVESFNGMVSELERSRRKLLQAERITAWQEIAQRLAHEIRNPLTPIKLSAQRILRRHADSRLSASPSPEAADEFGRVLDSSVSAIIKEVDNLERLLREFGEFAKLPTPRPAPVALREILAEVCSVYASLSSAVRIDTHEVPETVVLEVDKSQMKRVFANLFTNAIQAMPNGGVISVRADVVRKAHAAYCRIAVSDTGTGIPEEDRERIFDPYFTTKKDGTGLGLAIVQHVVFDHKGNVWAESNGSSGSTFFIDIPLGAASGGQP
jgi:nitrogen fixation/metabolism regulation signal transduction histidine kinase